MLAERDLKSFFKATRFYNDDVISNLQISIHFISLFMIICLNLVTWALVDRSDNDFSKSRDLNAITSSVSFKLFTLYQSNYPKSYDHNPCWKGVIAFYQSHVFLQ